MEKRKIDINKLITIVSILFLIMPVILGVGSSIKDSFSDRKVIIDYLLVAKLFPIIFIGTFLLFIVSKRTGLYRTHIRTLTLVIVLSFLVSNMIAVFTGLSAGEISSDGWEFMAILFFVGIYIISAVVQFIIGIILFLKLFDKNLNSVNRSKKMKKKKKR